MKNIKMKNINKTKYEPILWMKEWLFIPICTDLYEHIGKELLEELIVRFTLVTPWMCVYVYFICSIQIFNDATSNTIYVVSMRHSFKRFTCLQVKR